MQLITLTALPLRKTLEKSQPPLNPCDTFVHVLPSRIDCTALPHCMKTLRPITYQAFASRSTQPSILSLKIMRLKNITTLTTSIFHLKELCQNPRLLIINALIFWLEVPFRCKSTTSVLLAQITHQPITNSRIIFHTIHTLDSQLNYLAVNVHDIFEPYFVLQPEKTQGTRRA